MNNEEFKKKFFSKLNERILLNNESILTGLPQPQYVLGCGMVQAFKEAMNLYEDTEKDLYEEE